MDLGNSAPHCCNQILPDTILFRVASMTNLVSIHLKDFDGRDSRVLKPMVDLHVGVE